MITYIIIGLMWCAWLEYYTTKHQLPEARDWSTRERLFNTLLWPVSLGVFVITFLKQLQNERMRISRNYKGNK